MSHPTPTPLRILLADRDRAAMQTIASLLRRRGHQVVVTDSAEEAQRCNAEVLVCDLQLEGGNAFGVLEQLLHQANAPRVILVAERPNSEDCRRAQQLGALEVLAKPFRMVELVRAIEMPSAPLPKHNKLEAGALLQRHYRSMPGAEIQAARDVLALALRTGIGPASRARIGSAIAEIVDNARRHGYRDNAGVIEVNARLEQSNLIVTVRDTGCGFDASQLDASGLHDTHVHGIARARALAEELAIESSPSTGTRVELIFRTSHVAFEEVGPIDLSDHDFLSPELAERVLEAVRLNPRDQLFELSPALAVVVGRLLSSGSSRERIERELWS